MSLGKFWIIIISTYAQYMEQHYFAHLLHVHVTGETRLVGLSASIYIKIVWLNFLDFLPMTFHCICMLIYEIVFSSKYGSVILINYICINISGQLLIYLINTVHLCKHLLWLVTVWSFITSLSRSSATHLTQLQITTYAFWAHLYCLITGAIALRSQVFIQNSMYMYKSFTN